MNRTLPSIVAVSAFLATATTMYSQQPTRSPRYASILYLKVQPEKEAAFVDFYKTGLGMKVAKARLKNDSTVTNWSIRRAVYSGYPAPEANYTITTNMNTAPGEPNTAKRDALIRSVTDLTYPVYMEKVRALSQLVGNTLSHVHDVTPGMELNEGDVVVARRLKVASGKLSELSTANSSVRLAIMTERVKAGDLKGWSFSHLSFGGSELAWDANENMFYKDMASALQQNTPNSGMAIFAKLFPDRNFTRYVEEQRESSKLVRTDVYRVLVSLHQ